LISQPFIAAVKAALTEVGVPVGLPRAPVAALEPAAAARIAELASALHLVSAS
jgi:4-hydroxy-tetrahydrodipicolinate synthase